MLVFTNINGGQMSEDSNRKKPSRREQIIDATIKLISKDGISKATTARIAGEVGVSEPALYRHFQSKEEIIYCSLLEIGTRAVVNCFDAGANESDMIKKLRLMSGALYDYVMLHMDESTVIFEALTYSRNDNLRAQMRELFAGFLKLFEMILIEGMNQGSVREDIDVETVTWEIFALGVTLHFASILGMNNHLTKESAMKAVETILTGISTEYVKDD